jgi:hypothetical protein
MERKLDQPLPPLGSLPHQIEDAATIVKAEIFSFGRLSSRRLQFTLASLQLL